MPRLTIRRGLALAAVCAFLFGSASWAGLVTQSGPRLFSSGSEPPEQNILFQADMSDPGDDYGFATDETEDGTITHLPTCGHAGGPAMFFEPDNTNPTQYQMGFSTGSLGHTFNLADGFVY